MTLTTVWVTVMTAVLLAAAPAVAGPSGAGRAARWDRAATGVGRAAAGGGPVTRGAGGTGGAGRAGEAGGRSWPVAGPGVRGRPVVLRAFEPPPTPYAAGHRGVDLRAGPSAVVRAAAPGEVVFAGPVGGAGVLVLRIGADLRVTYEPVRATAGVGARVAAGDPVGVLAGGLAHCAGGCLHWGLLSGGGYLDPLSLLPAWIRRSGPSRLLPVGGTEQRAAGVSAR